MTEKQVAVAAGSIWNPNSWHWQMKNYTAVSKKLVQQKFLSMTLKDGDMTIISTKLRFDHAQAQVNIRKGKQYLVYQFQIEVDYRADTDADQVNGSYKVKEINGDDLEDIVVEDVRANQKGELGDRAKAFLKKNLKKEIKGLFKDFAQDLAKIESCPKKLEEDKKKREEAQLATQKARKEKGEEKERLLQEQREKERKMKEEFSKWGKKEGKGMVKERTVAYKPEPAQVEVKQTVEQLPKQEAKV